MHTLFLTIAVLGGDPAYYQPAPMAASPFAESDCGCEACQQCDAAECPHCKLQKIKGCAALRRQNRMSVWGPMPQSCYDPRYGCYGSDNRFVQRHPAFHGTYYRRPYNYRHLFEYPWHAALHEPTSMWSYSVEAEEIVPTTIQPLPPLGRRPATMPPTNPTPRLAPAPAPNAQAPARANSPTAALPIPPEPGPFTRPTIRKVNY